MQKKKFLQTTSKGVAPIIGLMIALIIGIGVAIPVVNTFTTRATSTFDQTNETHIDWNTTTDLTRALSGFGDGTEFTIQASSLAVYNSSDCSSGQLTLHTHYNLTGNGTDPTLAMSTVSKALVTPNYTCTTYTYFATTQYLTESVARTVVSNIVLIFSVSLLVITASVI